MVQSKSLTLSLSLDPVEVDRRGHTLAVVGIIWSWYHHYTSTTTVVWSRDLYIRRFITLHLSHQSTCWLLRFTVSKDLPQHGLTIFPEFHMRKLTIQWYKFKKVDLTETYEIKIEQGLRQSSNTRSSVTRHGSIFPDQNPCIPGNLAFFEGGTTALCVNGNSQPISLPLSATVPSQKQNYSSSETFLDNARLTFFRSKNQIKKWKDQDFHVGDEAEENMIAGQEQDYRRIFCNLNSPLRDRISSWNISRRYHDPNHRFDRLLCFVWCGFLSMTAAPHRPTCVRHDIHGPWIVGGVDLHSCFILE